jgi:alkaline phosphatase
LLLGAVPVLAAGEVVRIYPSDRATFLAGQRFDLRVEAEKLPADAQSIRVTVGGRDAGVVFGREAQVVKDGEGKASFTLRGVNLKEPGDYRVVATVKAGNADATAVVDWEVRRVPQFGPRAKNVILFIADGMSLPVRTAARILSKGFQSGKSKGLLAMDEMDEFGYVMTTSLDSLATDSANAASAYATGHKTTVNAMGVYPDNTADPNDNPRVETIIELVKRVRGMATGLVTTSDITDATPAAMFAHTRRRSEAAEIINQLLRPEQRPDVIMGGGSGWFIPKSAVGSKRKDDRDVIAEFEKLGYRFTGTATELASVNAATTDKLLGLYHLGNLNVYLDREVLKTDVLGDFTDQPTLPAMTKKAIDLLRKNPNGFFLMVESASVDKQLHPMDWERAIYDTIEFDQAVAVGKEFAKRNGDTLLIVVADHSHGMSITGTYHEMDGKKGREAVRVYEQSVYPTFVDRDGDGFPDSPAPEVTLAVHWANHPDYRDDYRFNILPLDPTVLKDGKAVPNPQRDPEGELQVGNLPLAVTTEVHSVEDVPITSSGPGARYLRGVLDNTEVFFGMVNALGLEATD